MDRPLIVKQQHSLQQHPPPSIITVPSDRPWYSSFSVSNSILQQPLVSALGSVFLPTPPSSSLDRPSNPWWSAIYRRGPSAPVSTVVELNGSRVEETCNCSARMGQLPSDEWYPGSSLLDNESSLSADSVNSTSCISTSDCSSLVSTTPPTSPTNAHNELLLHKEEDPCFSSTCNHLVIDMLCLWLCSHMMIQAMLLECQQPADPASDNQPSPETAEPVPLSAGPRRDSKLEDDSLVSKEYMEDKQETMTWAPFAESDTIARYAARHPAMADLWQQHEQDLEAYRQAYPVRPTERRRHRRLQQQQDQSSVVDVFNNSDNLMTLAHEALAYFESAYADQAHTDSDHLGNMLHLLRFRASSSSSTSTPYTH